MDLSDGGVRSIGVDISERGVEHIIGNERDDEHGDEHSNGVRGCRGCYVTGGMGSCGMGGKSDGREDAGVCHDTLEARQLCFKAHNAHFKWY